MPAIWRACVSFLATNHPDGNLTRTNPITAARQNRHEINVTPTETALHHTRLHDLDQEIISVLNFYKTSRLAAPPLWPWEHIQTEKIEKNFMLFQFSDRAVLRVKVTIN
ncbi:hypothetical protein [Serratia liquefaciens]|uniref:hypothetical protein n=1 Tax=Serratia liquefaciens TaxID=614 RepID=UPI0021C60918|nr:hypothetical protein [Serratia liquefaciens]